MTRILRHLVLLIALLVSVSGARAGTAGGQPISTVPLQAVRVADDDGGRRTPISPSDVADWVAYANATFSVAQIDFSFDPDAGDFVDLNSTLINNITGIGDTNWRAARAYANTVAAQYPGKLVVFFRWGPDSVPTGGGFSWWDYNFVAAPWFTTSVCGHQNISLLAHEFGHYLGLPHPFANVFETVIDAENHYVNSGHNPLVFDGDGIKDTVPDPFVWDIQCDEPNEITLAGDVFVLQTDNIMTYWDSQAKTLTADQIDRVTWLLNLRRQFDMAMPTNYHVPNANEFDSLGVLGTVDLSYGFQDMAGFGLDQWAENDQLFCGAGSNGSISFQIYVPETDTYDLDLYATQAPDFGIVGVRWDGDRIGQDLDLYAPLVIPTDELALGSVLVTAGDHVLTVTVVGRNDDSTNYFFGLDAIVLEPVGCHCDSVPGGCSAGLGFLASCLTGPDLSLKQGVPECASLCAVVFDRDADQDIDLLDVSVWMRQSDQQLHTSEYFEVVDPVDLAGPTACTAQKRRTNIMGDCP